MKHERTTVSESAQLNGYHLRRSQGGLMLSTRLQMSPAWCPHGPMLLSETHGGLRGTPIETRRRG